MRLGRAIKRTLTTATLATILSSITTLPEQRTINTCTYLDAQNYPNKELVMEIYEETKKEYETNQGIILNNVATITHAANIPDDYEELDETHKQRSKRHEEICKKGEMHITYTAQPMEKHVESEDGTTTHPLTVEGTAKEEYGEAIIFGITPTGRKEINIAATMHEIGHLLRVRFEDKETHDHTSKSFMTRVLQCKAYEGCGRGAWTSTTRYEIRRNKWVGLGRGRNRKVCLAGFDVVPENRISHQYTTGSNCFSLPWQFF